MNGKQAKKLRVIARRVGTDGDVVVLKPMQPQHIFSPGDVLRVGKSAVWLGQRELAGTCARAAYQRAKKLFRSMGPQSLNGQPV